MVTHSTIFVWGIPLISHVLAGDTFGPRMTGSEGLEKSLDWIAETARADGMKVLREPVQVPNWRRGVQSLTMEFPDGQKGVPRDVPVIALGLSVGTGGAPLTADLVVVASWDELDLADVAGKMVLMNVPWDGYNSQCVVPALPLWIEVVRTVGVLNKRASRASAQYNYQCTGWEDSFALLLRERFRMRLVGGVQLNPAVLHTRIEAGSLPLVRCAP